MIARRIFDLYIDEDGLLCLNIDQADRYSVAEHMNKLPSSDELKEELDKAKTKTEATATEILDLPDNLFDQVKLSVRANINDTFARFQESKMYSEWVEYSEKQKAISEGLRDANLL